MHLVDRVIYTCIYINVDVHLGARRVIPHPRASRGHSTRTRIHVRITRLQPPTRLPTHPPLPSPLHLVASLHLHGAQDGVAVAEEVVGVGVGEVAVAPEGGVVVLQDAARLLLRV